MGPSQTSMCFILRVLGGSLETRALGLPQGLMNDRGDVGVLGYSDDRGASFRFTNRVG